MKLLFLLLTPFWLGCASSKWQLAYEQEFRSQACLEDFQFSDPDIWHWADDFGGMMYFTEGSNFKPPHRSPLTYGLIQDLQVDAFVLEAEVQQSGRNYSHRDLCLFFAFESPAKYGYVHIATQPDPHAHNIFLVNHAPRIATAPVGEQGVDWGKGWHLLRMERLQPGGPVDVYLDGKLILHTENLEFGVGQLGFGSFDDSGRIRSLKIWVPTTNP